MKNIIIALVCVFMVGCAGAFPTVEIEYEPPDIVTEQGIVVDQGKIVYHRKGEQEISGLDVKLNEDTTIKLDASKNTASEEAIANMAEVLKAVTEFIDKHIPVP